MSDLEKPEESKVSSDNENTLNKITELMSGTEWNWDTLEEIAILIRATGRKIEVSE